ncbi:MAG: hypothetical protein OMM_13526, partial [Candidatus Magnetoglobus multicellularis str. Araruama]
SPDINSGDITIQAKKFFFDANINSGTMKNQNGSAGNISLSGEQFKFYKASTITASSLGTGQSGKIVLNAKHSIHLSGNISSNAFYAGDAGTIEIRTPLLIMDNASKIYSLSSQTLNQTVPSGKGGDIIIHTDQLFLQDVARISSKTNSDSSGGNISIHATQFIDVNAFDAYEKMGLFSESNFKLNQDRQGNAGNISILTPVLMLKGKHANIKSGTTTSGAGGNISLNVNQLFLDENAIISTQSQKNEDNAGNAGNIYINAKQKMSLFNNSSILTKAQNASGGKIEINTSGSLILLDSLIESSVKIGINNGGDIRIFHPDVIAMKSGKILAQAYQGNGGNISISAENIIQSTESMIDASALLGIDGYIHLDIPGKTSMNQVIQLPDNFLQAEKWSKTPCKLKNTVKEDRLVQSVRDSIPY